MIATKEMTLNDDSELVAASLSGNRDAFGHIVARYQSLVCSLAYSATGNLNQSEDLAQETFLTAWKQLSALREPAKLRSWLCGIARNVTNNWLRQNGREPSSHAAEPLEALQESPAPGPLPHDQTISNEEAALLWRSLERIPEIYREPLVMFYREHQSITNVAAALDLNEDAVKQRLSRGRKLLHEQVLAFVEGALERTSPGKAFTLGVLAALPVFATSASAATAGVAAAKGTSAAKASAFLGLSTAVIGPLVGILGAWLGVRASLMNAQTERERQFIRKTTKSSLILITIFCVVGFSVFFLSTKIWKAHPWLLTGGLIAVSLGYVVALCTLIFKYNRQLAQIRAEDIAAGHAQPIARRRGEEFEYRSAWTLLGWPLIHVCFGLRADGKRRVAKGWIAVGDIACGGIAFGGLSLGLISVGGLSLGGFSLGGVALGILAFGGLGIGWWAIGGCAIGYLAFGGSALGWHAAFGGAAMAHEFAWGGAAFAPHANDEAASLVAKNLPFFKNAQAIMTHASLLVWVPMGFLIWQALYLQKRAREKNLRK